MGACSSQPMGPAQPDNDLDNLDSEQQAVIGQIEVGVTSSDADKLSKPVCQNQKEVGVTSFDAEKLAKPVCQKGLDTIDLDNPVNGPESVLDTKVSSHCSQVSGSQDIDCKRTEVTNAGATNLNNHTKPEATDLGTPVSVAASKEGTDFQNNSAETKSTTVISNNSTNLANDVNLGANEVISNKSTNLANDVNLGANDGDQISEIGYPATADSSSYCAAIERQATKVYDPVMNQMVYDISTVGKTETVAQPEN